MYVILEAERNVMLPYCLSDGVKGVCTFIPGKNEIEDKIWSAILKQNAQGYEIHYSKFLRPFNTKFDTGCKKHLNDYTEEEMIEIVSHSSSIGFLEHLLGLELERTLDFKPRPAVVAAIKAKIPIKEWALEDLNRMGNDYRNYRQE